MKTIDELRRTLEIQMACECGSHTPALQPLKTRWQSGVQEKSGADAGAGALATPEAAGTPVVRNATCKDDSNCSRSASNASAKLPMTTLDAVAFISGNVSLPIGPRSRSNSTSSQLHATGHQVPSESARGRTTNNASESQSVDVAAAYNLNLIEGRLQHYEEELRRQREAQRADYAPEIEFLGLLGNLEATAGNRGNLEPGAFGSESGSSLGGIRSTGSACLRAHGSASAAHFTKADKDIDVELCDRGRPADDALPEGRARSHSPKDLTGPGRPPGVVQPLDEDLRSTLEGLMSAVKQTLRLPDLHNMTLPADQEEQSSMSSSGALFEETPSFTCNPQAHYTAELATSASLHQTTPRLEAVNCRQGSCLSPAQEPFSGGIPPLQLQQRPILPPQIQVGRPPQLAPAVPVLGPRGPPSAATASVAPVTVVHVVRPQRASSQDNGSLRGSRGRGGVGGTTSMQQSLLSPRCLASSSAAAEANSPEAAKPHRPRRQQFI
jgi:hypothetical protein